MFKKNLSAFLAVTFVATSVFQPIFSVSAGRGFPGFTDVNSSNPFYNYIMEAGSAGAIKGYSDWTFRPNNAVTRIEALAILLRIKNPNIDFSTLADGSNSDFSDVDSNQWFTPMLNYAKAQWITNGYSDGTFRGSNNISRAEVAILIKRIFNISDSQGSSPFNDVSNLPSNLQNAIDALYTAGIAKGNNGNFNPFYNVTRGEITAFAERANTNNSSSTSNITKISSLFLKNDWVDSFIKILSSSAPSTALNDVSNYTLTDTAGNSVTDFNIVYNATTKIIKVTLSSESDNSYVLSFQNGDYSFSQNFDTTTTSTPTTNTGNSTGSSTDTGNLDLGNLFWTGTTSTWTTSNTWSTSTWITSTGAIQTQTWSTSTGTTSSGSTSSGIVYDWSVTITQTSSGVVTWSVPNKATKIKAIGLTITNGSSDDLVINEVKSYITGLWNRTNIDGVYFMDSNGILIGSKKSVVSGFENGQDGIDFTFYGTAFKIPAKSVSTVYLTFDLKSVDSSNNQYIFSVQSINATKSFPSDKYTFPYLSSPITIAGVNTSLITISNPDSSALTANIGENNISLANFNLQTDNVWTVTLNTIKFRNGWSANTTSALSNQTIAIWGNTVPATVSIVNDSIYFKLTTPYIIPKNTNTSVQVFATISGEIARTVSLYLESDSINAVDQNGFWVQSNITALNTTTEWNTITINGSKINLSTTTLTQTETNSNVTRFTMFNGNLTIAENINFDDFNFGVVSQTVGKTELEKETEVSTYLQNPTIRITNITNGTWTVSTYTAESTLGTLTNGKLFDFRNVSLWTGIYKIEFVSDIISSAPQNTKFQVKFDSTNVMGSYSTNNDRISSSDFSVGTLNGQTITVSQPTAVFTNNPLNTTTVVGGAMNLWVYDFKVQANNISDLKLGNVSIKINTATQFSDVFDRLYLYKGTTKLAEISSLGSRTVTFNSISDVIPKNTTTEYTISGDVKANLSSNVSFSFSMLNESALVLRDSLNTLLSTSSKIGLSSEQAGAAFTVLASGTARVESLFDESTFSQDRLAVANSTWTIVWRIKVNPNYEDATLKKLVLENIWTATTTDINSVTLYKSNVLTSDNYIGQGTINSNKKIVLSGLNTIFTKDQIAYIYFVVNFKNIWDVGWQTGTSGRTVKLQVVNYEFLGNSSSQTITPLYVLGDTNSLITISDDTEGATDTLKATFAAWSPTAAQLATTQLYVNGNKYIFTSAANSVSGKNINVGVGWTNATTITASMSTVIWNSANEWLFYTTSQADANLSLSLALNTSLQTKTFTYYPSLVTDVSNYALSSTSLNFGWASDLGAVQFTTASQNNQRNHDVVKTTITQLQIAASHNLDDAGGLHVTSLYIERVWGTFPKQALILGDTVSTSKHLYNIDGTTLATNAAMNTALKSSNGIILDNLDTLLGVDAQIAPWTVAVFKISGTLSTSTTTNRYFQLTVKELRTTSLRTSGIQWKADANDSSSIVGLKNPEIPQDLPLTQLKNY